MKTFTNHTPGLRGINTTDGTVWIEPGESLELDPKTFVGDPPDLGKAGSAPADDAGLEDLNAKVAELTKQVETLEGEKAELAKIGAELAKDKAELTKQVDELTKPAKTDKPQLDHDKDGKAGGAAPAKD